MEINFFSLIEMIRLALPLLHEGAKPIIVNIGSIVGLRGTPHNSEYSASKFAVQGFSESLRGGTCRRRRRCSRRLSRHNANRILRQSHRENRRTRLARTQSRYARRRGPTNRPRHPLRQTFDHPIFLGPGNVAHQPPLPESDGPHHVALRVNREHKTHAHRIPLHGMRQTPANRRPYARAAGKMSRMRNPADDPQLRQRVEHRPQRPAATQIPGRKVVQTVSTASATTMQARSYRYCWA